MWENVILGLYEHGEHYTARLEAEARRTLLAVGMLTDMKESDHSLFVNEYAIVRIKKSSDLSSGMRKRWVSRSIGRGTAIYFLW